MDQKLKAMVDLMPRKDKMGFLMNSGLHDINDLIEMDKDTLNDHTMAGLEATGFKFRPQKA